MSKTPASTAATGPWLTRAQAAEILDLTSRTIDRWAEEGFLVPYRIGGRHTPRYTRADVDRVLAAQGEREKLRNELAKDSRWLTKTEAARYLGVTEHTLSVWTHQRVITRHYGNWAYGRYVPSYFHRDELDAVLVGDGHTSE